MTSRREGATIVTEGVTHVTHSYAVPKTVSCPGCEQTYDFDAWVIIDVDERPDLTRDLCAPFPQNAIHLPTCPACGTWGFLLDLPLLLYLPNQHPPLLFSPSSDPETEEEWESAWNNAYVLFEHLRESVGANWRPEWNDQVAVVARESLPAVLAEGFSSVFRDAGSTASPSIAHGRPEAARVSPESSIGDQIDTGSRLTRRFDESGLVSDLDTAIKIFEQTATATTQGSSDWIEVKIGLGNALRKRFEALSLSIGARVATTGSKEVQEGDLDAAIAAYQEAVDESERDAALRARASSALAGALVRRFTVNRDRDDLNLAIHLFQDALTNAEEGSSESAVYNHNLGAALLSRFESGAEPADLEGAIVAFKAACAAAAPGASEWAHRQAHVGEALFRRFETRKQEQDLAAAIVAFESALTVFHPDVSPAPCFNLANRLGQIQFERREWTKAANNLVQAVQAMNALSGVQAADTHRDAWLGRGQFAYSKAAYALARIGDLRHAVVVLEQARAHGLSPVLAQRDGESPREITWNDITAAVPHGAPPLVYLSTEIFGSLALVVHEPSTLAEQPEPSVDVLWLPAFTEQDLNQLMIGSEGDLENAAGWAGAYTCRHENPDGWFDAIEQGTRRLWDGLMGPVVEYTRSLNWDRAVLVPFGLLALLPLHAAWTESDGRRVYALDSVAFAYTSSARLLTHARRVAQLVPDERAKLLAVNEPQPVTDAAPLDNADIEVQGIASLFPSPKVLRHEEATRERIIKELRHTQVAHFACHAMTNWLDPLESGLLLASDSWLTVRNLSEMQLGAARLAVLSACETGIIGLRLPDEVVSLPSALLKAGFAGVLASMWEVEDQSTAMLMRRFYALWQTKGIEPVQALQEAQQWLRNVTTRDKTMFSLQRVPAPLRQVIAILTTMSFIAGRLVNAPILRRPPKRPFEHPYSWAAFYFTGV
jgi:CHAT domain-containing protein